MIYRIYINSPAGMSFTGIITYSEQEAKDLCEKYNSQDDNPYCQYVYVAIDPNSAIN